jgi:hypothetical protein
MKSLAPYLKALTPLALAIVASIVNTVAANGFNNLSWQVLVGGVLAAIATYLVPNAPKPAPVPAPVKK